jgi:hypothetical protein
LEVFLSGSSGGKAGKKQLPPNEFMAIDTTDRALQAQERMAYRPTTASVSRASDGFDLRTGKSPWSMMANCFARQRAWLPSARRHLALERPACVAD